MIWKLKKNKTPVLMAQSATNGKHRKHCYIHEAASFLNYKDEEVAPPNPTLTQLKKLGDPNQ